MRDIINPWRAFTARVMHLSMLCPTPPCTGIGGDLTHRMCQIPHPSITIQCQIPTLYIHTRICAGTRANACAGQKPHPWGVISWRIPYQAPPLSPTGGGVGRNIDRRITVLGLSFCLLPRFLPLRTTRRPIRDTNGFSATVALF